MTERLLTIGSFSLMGGLSIAALRHYDAVGLLKPASVDPETGYRRYRMDQLDRARLIRRLRAVDLPIDAIAAVLASPDEDAVRAILVEHRRTLAERQRALTEAARTVDDYVERGVSMPGTIGVRIVEINLAASEPDALMAFYRQAFDVTFEADRHGDGPVHHHVQFGTWPSEQFFLLNVTPAAAGAPARPTSFGFLVDDLEAVHRRALAAGGSEIAAPCDVPGMPRTSTVEDPGGNLVNLYQA